MLNNHRTNWLTLVLIKVVKRRYITLIPLIRWIHWLHIHLNSNKWTKSIEPVVISPSKRTSPMKNCFKLYRLSITQGLQCFLYCQWVIIHNKCGDSVYYYIICDFMKSIWVLPVRDVAVIYSLAFLTSVTVFFVA